MKNWREAFHRIQAFFGKRDRDAQLDAEFRLHLDLLAEEHVRRGMTPEQARHAARREFGGLEKTKQSYRERRGLPFLDTFIQDLRFGMRMLQRKPGFTAVAVLTLAVGIGANTAIFSVVHAVLLQPFPYPHEDRLAIVWSVFGNEGRAPASGPELVYLREHSRLFEEFGGIWVQSGALTGESEPEQLKLGLVTSNFLNLLSAKPQLGRFFLPEEQRWGAAPVIILSDGIWQRRFGADPHVIGRVLRINTRAVTVVGVMPPGFRVIFPEGTTDTSTLDAFVPFPSELAKDARDQYYIRVVGRLKKGVTTAQAQSELDEIAAHLRAEFKEFSEVSLNLRAVPLHGDVVRNLRPALLALFAGVGFVLLIACSNVANLLLSQAGQRQREITLRAALGAGRGRVIRQLLTESVLLSCLGGAAALFVGWGALQLLLSLRPTGMERLGTIGLDSTAFAFTSAISIVAGILFGLAPALGITKLNLVESLKEGGRTIAAGKRRSRDFLIVCEVALGFVLLIGAALMIQTFASVLRVDPGFAPSNVLTFHISSSYEKYPNNAAFVHFFRELQKNIAALPAVESAGVTSHLPFDDSLPNWYSSYWPEGAPKEEQNTVMADYRSILPGYFESIGATLVSGRGLDNFDVAESRHVAVIDDFMANTAWPNGTAVGKLLNIENGDFVRDKVEIVGVVKHIQSHSLTDPVRTQIYLPYPLGVRLHMAMTVKSKGNPEALVPMIREQVAKLDKDLPIYNIQPMEAYVERARRETRFTSMLSGALAGIALLLACTGIYGVTSYSVLQRTNEIGIRVALGAKPAGIYGMVIRQAMFPLAVGLAIGIALSLALTPLLSTLLFGIRPSDPLTLIASCAFISGVGLAACAIPARRAVRIDPVVALRYE